MATTEPLSNAPEAAPPHAYSDLAHLALDHVVVEPGWFNGVSVRSLEPGTVLIVHTRQSRYRLVMLDTPQHVLVSGGSLFLSPEEAYVVGATAGGSRVKRAWIGIGLRLELRLGKRRVSTSPVERIAIEGSVGVHAEPLAR